MRPPLHTPVLPAALALAFAFALSLAGPILPARAEPEFALTEDSKPHDGVPKGELIKGSYTAKEGSVFPGTEREYTIYLPAKEGSADTPVRTNPEAGKSARAPGSPFMVFQDGVIYQAPVVFDNLIAKKQIPPLIGLFIKPGVVPAANANALPRYNRSYEYDSVTDTYSRFLLEEFIPAIEQKHGLKLSSDPNEAAIAGNSSGGICAFMTAWHRPDRIRRVFSGVGTYVRIHGADQLPVLVRKYEPKPLRVFLQSGTNDNNLYCGDWWMANQMMERSLTWAGYDVNHAWGEGGHNAKHATAIFPDVLRWLWRDYATEKEIKANPRGDSKWRGYEVVGDGGWEAVIGKWEPSAKERDPFKIWPDWRNITSNKSGELFASDRGEGKIVKLSTDGQELIIAKGLFKPTCLAVDNAGGLFVSVSTGPVDDSPLSRLQIVTGEGKILDQSPRAKASRRIDYINPQGEARVFSEEVNATGFCLLPDKDRNFVGYIAASEQAAALDGEGRSALFLLSDNGQNVMLHAPASHLACTPDQSTLIVAAGGKMLSSHLVEPNGLIKNGQDFFQLETDESGICDARGLCVDTNGWLYVATALGIQVCDQAGRVNFIIPTPQPPHDVCFGGRDLGELFIACGDKIYKRPTKARGIVSGQMPPIKPAAPKL